LVSNRTLITLAAVTFLSVAHVAPSRADAVTLVWTAPGADSLTGRASRYDLRYSTRVITPVNFIIATPVTGVPAPLDPGTRQSCVVSGLLSQSTYYFALRTVDQAGNWSAVSNVVSRAPQEVAGDLAELRLGFSAPWPNPAREQARFDCALPEAAQVGVEVFDIVGRRVRLLADEPRAAGSQELVFDLRDDHGLRLAAGVYLVRARLGVTVFTRRLVIAR
jgi:hypothetical protein